MFQIFLILTTVPMLYPEYHYYFDSVTFGLYLCRHCYTNIECLRFTNMVSAEYPKRPLVAKLHYAIVNGIIILNKVMDMSLFIIGKVGA